MYLVATRLTSSVIAAGLALTAFASSPAVAQEGDAAGEVLFIRAGKVVVRPGEVIENAQVIVEDGLIREVGTNLVKPEGAREIEGAVVCASFIDPWSTLGLSSDSVNDAGTNAATRTIDGLDPYTSAELREDVLRAGVTVVRTQAGSRAKVQGVAAIVRVAPGLDSDDAIVLSDAAVGAAVGVTTSRAADPFDRQSDVDRLVGLIESGRKYREDHVEYKYKLEEWKKEISEKEAELEKDFKKAKKARDKKKSKADEEGDEFKDKKYKEDKRPKAPKVDEAKASMARVADGEMPLVVHVHRAAELRSLLGATSGFDRLRLVVAGGTEALVSAKELAERHIPVIVWPTPLGASNADEYAGHDLSLAGRLAEKGVTVLLGSGGLSFSTRDLPLLAGLAIGHGLDREDAFAALTTRAARVLDVSDRFGTVESGKDADLLVLDGEPLVSTTRVRYVVTAGRVAVSPEE